jgi:hypothetical protein
MNRSVIFAAVMAASAFLCQAAYAHDPKQVDPRVPAVSIGVGAASAAGYFAINNWKLNGWDNSSGLTRLAAVGVTTIGCAAASPIVATMVLNRPLTFREAHYLIASCVIPIIGGWLVNQAYDAHPEWEPGYVPAEKKTPRQKEDVVIAPRANSSSIKTAGADMMSPPAVLY